MVPFEFKPIAEDVTGYKVYVEGKYSYEIRKKDEAFRITDHRKADEKGPPRSYSSLETAVAYLALRIVAES